METHKDTYPIFLKKEPLLHVFIWGVVLFYPYVKYLGREGGYMLSFSHELNSLLFKMIISYFLYVWYFPKKNKFKYLPIAITALIANAIIYEFFDRFFHTYNTHFWKHFIANVLTYLGFSIVFFAIYSVKELYKKQKKIDSLSREKKAAELSALKAQVNPHFLFNTLNTIYANALKKDDKTPDLILKLSDSFRYVLHEGQKEKVSIQQEIQHLRDYINLQEERLSNKVLVYFSSNIREEKVQIPPLLFIAFIENAFKYTSLLKGEKHKIRIAMELTNKELRFLCINPYSEGPKQDIDVQWEESGVGITSTKKRLQLLYPSAHQLAIKKEDGKFMVTLKIEL